ncbi:DUF6706 family protein [Pleomorphovibrio marinus]|uniref:DUF6706 family protein n=1 Tax=Pleomorphovibrio marinus TaxID=2164132 RepID=UPI000E0C2DA6|nr:DUF6706 family protein [Pleomorphovibrio marinus]
MTVRGAVLAQCAIEVNEDLVDLEIINSDLNGVDTYSNDLEKEVAYVACKVLQSLIYSSLKEGDLTITYDKDLLQKRLSYLSGKHGFDEFNSQPKVRNKSYLW